MTDEELDMARGDEAVRQLNAVNHRGYPDGSDYAARAARLAREGWTPEDPILKEAREVYASSFAWRDEPLPQQIRRGDHDANPFMVVLIAALRRGIEIGEGDR